MMAGLEMNGLHLECRFQLLRKKQKQLLAEADQLVNQAEDMGLDSSPQRQYRQWLRDVSEAYKDNPEAVEWKEPPLPQPSA